MIAPGEIEKFLAELQHKDGTAREHARMALVKIGKPAVPYLIALLSDPRHQMRWEACKALGTIMDPSAAAPLVTLLNDDSVEIRWLAAEALIALEQQALPPLMKFLQTKFESPFVREGAQHILHVFAREHLLSRETKAVLDALRYMEPKISVAWAAHRALHSMTTHVGNH